jgi:hypothetical protein
MKPLMKAPAYCIIREQRMFIAHGQSTAKAMAKVRRAGHKCWNLPPLSRKDGKLIATKPWEAKFCQFLPHGPISGTDAFLVSP